MAEGKQRHGCLTAWLVIMIVANAATALLYLVGSAAIRQRFAAAPAWAFPVLIAAGVGNIICAIALFRWKKWGFFGALALAVVIFVINLIVGLSVIETVLGFIGVAILYGVLQIGT